MRQASRSPHLSHILSAYFHKIKCTQKVLLEVDYYQLFSYMYHELTNSKTSISTFIPLKKLAVEYAHKIDTFIISMR